MYIVNSLFYLIYIENDTLFPVLVGKVLGLAYLVPNPTLHGYADINGVKE
jgi:hypothetical protein